VVEQSHHERNPSSRRIRDVVTCWSDMAARVVDALVIEDQIPGGRLRGKGLSTLILRRARWEVCAELAGLPVIRVHPGTWRSWARVLTGRPSAQEIDRRVSKLVKAIWCVDAEGDEADAIVIGFWALATRKEG
jgi:hypothetical protein